MPSGLLFYQSWINAINMFRALMLFIRIDKRKFRLVISRFETVKNVWFEVKQTYFNTEKSSEVNFLPIIDNYTFFLHFRKIMVWT